MTRLNLNASASRRLHALPQLETVPAWVTARDALAAAQAVRLPTNAGESLGDIADDIATAHRAGSALDLDALTARVVDVDRHTDARNNLQVALTNAERALMSELDHAAATAVPTVLKALHAEMRDVADHLGTIAMPGQLVDANAAERAGRLADYSTFRDLRDRYTSIRSAQAVCYDHASGASSHYGAAALIRGQETLMRSGEWTDSQRGGTCRNEHGELVLPPAVPWPILYVETTHAALTPLDFLDWAIGHPGALAALWVPTPAQLAEETKRLDSLLASAYPPEVLTTRERTI